jgi:hypothetical protein
MSENSEGATPPATDTFDPVGATPLEIRLAMVDNVYPPTPLKGKKPILDNWPNIVADRAMVERWGNMGPNTGMLTATVPVLDIDILNEQAAQIVEDVARQVLTGQILVRIGQAPKRAIYCCAPIRRSGRLFASLPLRTAPCTRSRCSATANSWPWPAYIPIQTSRISGRAADLRSTPRERSCRRRKILRPSSTCALPN